MIHSIEKGGAETYIFNLLKNPKDGINFFVICNHKGENHNKLVSISKNVEIIKMKNILDLKAARKLANFCKENEIHIVQTHFLRENYIAILSKIFNPRIKIIWTTHLVLNNNKQIMIFNKMFSKFVDRIICVSQAVKTSLINEGISKEKIKVIYNGVDTDYFKPRQDSYIREEFQINKDTLVLTTVARFHEDKGHRFLIEALSGLAINFLDFKMILVGHGEEEPSIRQMVKDHGLEEHVIFLGYREDIVHILSASDIYISPSKNEAISFSILEALSCGIPVIATAVGGVVEIFHKGQVGILISFGDKNEFTKSIIHLTDNSKKYRDFVANSRKVVIDHFSQSNMLKGIYDLYDEIL